MVGRMVGRMVGKMVGSAIVFIGLKLSRVASFSLIGQRKNDQVSMNSSMNSLTCSPITALKAN